MPDKIEYRIFNIPLLGQNIAASRVPRLQPSVPAEFAQMLSAELADWGIDENGEPLHKLGQTITDRLEFRISKDVTGPRTHWPMPTAAADAAESLWLSDKPSITERGKRLQELEKGCGSKAAALILFKEEAQRFGITNAMSLQQGTKPGEKSNKKADDGNKRNNPWAIEFAGDEAARLSRITSIIKTSTKLADSMARSAGTTVGKPLRKAS